MVWMWVYFALGLHWVYFGVTLRLAVKLVYDVCPCIITVCEKYADAVANNCSPDLILDLTVDREMSEAAKTFSANLGIPTVAAAHSMFGDLRCINGNHPVNYKGCAIYQEIKRKINPSQKFLKESRTATGSARAEVSSRSFTADKPDVTHQTYAQAAATPKSAPNSELQNDYGPIILGEKWSGTMDFEMRLDLVTTSSFDQKVIGYWKSKDKDLFIFENISSIKAKPIYKVAVIVLPPFTMVTKDESGKEMYKGYCIDLIDEISKMLGFEYQMYRVADNTPGTMDEHGRWSGIVKEVLEKRADIGLSSMSVTAEREDVVEFTMPFYDLIGMNILMKKTKPSTAFFKFFSALGSDVWLCIIVVYIVASALIWTFEQFSLLINQEYHKRLWGTEDKREFIIKECLWFCMTSLTPQGGGEGLRTTSARVVAAVWWLFGFILISSYTANLAAFLTVSRLDTSINSLEDLANQYKVQYAPMNGSQGQTYFQRMATIEAKFQREWMHLVTKENMSGQERSELALWRYPVGDKFTKMWKAMQTAGLPKSLEDAVDRVLASKSSTEGFALIESSKLRRRCEVRALNQSGSLHGVVDEVLRRSQ
ncbi:ionotropic receptor 25a-like [Macrosteles quadrilineatus]|uniref:ionotropic receptor 25a-like n=1 Tax=Macrosteles quadrilineatus TaxID=74068 RepID=UPI0023E18255|nr:ionotropic receptor 25a-like [Macrosteles quadrilineatus]